MYVLCVSRGGAARARVFHSYTFVLSRVRAVCVWLLLHSADWCVVLVDMYMSIRDI